ncbi:MAG: glycine zipper domain-containing protein [Myxococcota bacterium]
MSEPTLEQALRRTASAATSYATAELTRTVGPEVVDGVQRFVKGDPRALYDSVGAEAERRGHAKRTAYAGAGGLLGAILGSFFGRFGAAFGALAGALFGATMGQKRDARPALPPQT